MWYLFLNGVVEIVLVVGFFFCFLPLVLSPEAADKLSFDI